VITGMHHRLAVLILAAAALVTSVAAGQYDNPAWTAPTEPFRIAGPIHYVGTADLAAYLITTTEGHILLDGAVPESAALIEQSIRSLGFKPEDIKILLISQAHFDHVGTLASFKRLTGASVQVMRGDETLVADGGKSDYLFGANQRLHFAPVPVDRVLQDGDVVRLGGVSLTARHTPGHTPGCTTWLMQVTERGRPYSVVFAGSLSVNPGTRLLKQPSYPGIADDYRRSIATLEALKPDVFLAAHASFFDLAARRPRMKHEGVRAFVDLAAYQTLIAGKKAEFEALVAKEQR
jgi:metallo-beta-lactamase class B